MSRRTPPPHPTTDITTGPDPQEVAIPTLADLWHRVIGTQPDPPLWLVLAYGAVALAAVTSRRIWRITRNVVTIAHEAGHAFTALLTGRRLAGIRLHSDTSGVTLSAGRPTGPGMVLTTAAGYVAPSALGFAGAGLLATGHVTALLWIGIVLLAAVLVMIRNAYGVLSVVTTGGTLFAVSWLASPTVQAAFAYVVVWFLLVAGTRPILELQRTRRRRPGLRSSDADQLARLTGVPGTVWVGLFLVVALAALFAGGRWLLLTAGA